jgi:hypothetical protein
MLSYFTSSPFSSIALGNGSTMPIYCAGHTQLPSPTTPLIKYLSSVYKFTFDNLVSLEFDPFSLSVKDYLAKVEIACLNSSGDIYFVHGAPRRSTFLHAGLHQPLTLMSWPLQ